MRPPIRALLAAVALVVATEGALALLGLPDPGLYEGDPARVWWVRPGLDRQVPFPERGTTFRVTTDPHGFRGESPPEAGPWTLALGCSTTFGWGVEDAEAWPARLGAITGEAVVNGGVPGWSTEQAVRGVPRFLELHPTRVILAFGVRDATPAARADRDARPTPWPFRTHLGRALLAIRAPAAPPGGPTWRVPPDDFAQNLRALARLSAPATVVLLAFPQREPAVEWTRAMRSVGPTLEPELPGGAFFPEDPMHLSPAGHDELARWLAPRLSPPDPG